MAQPDKTHSRDSKEQVKQASQINEADQAGGTDKKLNGPNRPSI
ncbi:hypothetical protein P9314_20490 [Paenibacillus validus]|nr:MULTISPECIES: hypothetical protein [Paenibacillus]MED4603004.1 hypothetical protein [Paenibacillus validus]MED4608253.1 hypothetical protein [Paenibacillus validus]